MANIHGSHKSVQILLNNIVEIQLPTIRHKTNRIFNKGSHNPTTIRHIRSPSSLDVVKEELKCILSDTKEDARRPFCNCLIDICRSKNLHKRAHDLLYLGTLYGLYLRLHNKTSNEWSLNVRTLSVGAAETALEEWIGTLAKIIKHGEALSELFSAQTGTETHKFARGLSKSFASHLKELGVPFKQNEDKVGRFVATREDFVLWLQSKTPSSGVASS